VSSGGDGAILVFLPGLMEITTLLDNLKANTRDFPPGEWLEGGKGLLLGRIRVSCTYTITYLMSYASYTHELTRYHI